MKIEHEPDAERFVARVDGEEAEVNYERDGDVLGITHTGVPDSIGGRGIAGELNRAVFNFARENGLKVRPLCSYAVTWSKRHPEFDDILA